MKKILLFFCSIFFFQNASTLAQPKVIDLSKNQKERTFVVRPSSAFDIIIENMIPAKSRTDAQYSIFLEKKFHAPDPLELKIYTPATATEGIITFCTETKGLIKELQESDSEQDVKTNKEELQKKLKESGINNCPSFLIVEAYNLIDATQLFLPANKLAAGEYLELKIRRKDTDGKEISWVFTFDAGKKGQWITSYGFSFATHAFSNEGAYYLKQETDDNGNKTDLFKITEEEDRKYMDFIPSIMFSYLKNNNKTWKWSLTGGVGIDTNKPTAFLGVSAFYNYNIGLSLGLIAHPQKQLKGRYKKDGNEILSELIEIDQLHNEPYRINPFFSVSFRFAENPFQQKEQ